MRVFAISHSSVVERFRRKWTELAGFPGIDLTLLVPSSWPEAGRHVRCASQQVTPRYRIIAAPVLFRGTHALHFYPSLAYHMCRSRPNIVHIEEEPWNVVTCQAVCLARLLGARVIFFTWENVRRRYPPPLSLLLGVVLRLADRAIAGSEHARDLLRARGFRRKIDVLPQYGIDPPPDWRGVRSGGQPFTVGFAGRLIAEKGLDTLVEAFAELPADSRLLVVGNGPYRASLLEQAGRLALQHRLEMVGAVPHDTIAGYLGRMDVLVLPSRTTGRWREQFGRVLVEAMALGVPVVGSDSGAIPAVIGDAGLVFAEGDSRELARHLRALRADERLRSGLAERGHARARSCFSNGLIAERTHAIYQDVLPGT